MYITLLYLLFFHCQYHFFTSISYNALLFSISTQNIQNKKSLQKEASAFQKNPFCGLCPHLQTFLKKSLTKNFIFCIRNRFSFTTSGALLLFSHKSCSSPTHRSEIKFRTKVLCLLSFKKVSYFSFGLTLPCLKAWGS